MHGRTTRCLKLPHFKDSFKAFSGTCIQVYGMYEIMYIHVYAYVLAKQRFDKRYMSMCTHAQLIIHIHSF